MIILAVLLKMIIPEIVLSDPFTVDNVIGFTTLPVAIHCALLIVLSFVLWKMYRLCDRRK